MKRLALIAAVACACAAPSPSNEPDTAAIAAAAAEPAANAVEALLDRIEQRAAEIETLQAKIIFDRIQGLQGDEQRRFGTVAYDATPPARFHIHFDRMIDNGAKRRDDEHWIFDGYWLAQRDDNEKTLIRYEVARPGEDRANPFDLNDGPFVLPLDLKKESVLNRFEANIIDTPGPDDPIHLRLVPKPDVTIELTQIDLWYDRQTLLPTAFQSIDGDSEEKSSLELRKITLNKKLKGESFDTTAPKGPGWTKSEHRLEAEP